MTNIPAAREKSLSLAAIFFYSLSLFSHITMNLPNKLTGVFFTLGLGFLLSGCESMFHDDLDNCPQAVYVKLYNTTCKADSIGLNTQSNVHLLAFDEDNKLAASAELKDIDLGNKQKGFTEVRLPIKSDTPDQDRVYNIYAWTGVNGKFSAEAKIGDKKDQVFASLRSGAESQYVNLGSDRVYFGQAGRSVVLKNPAKNGSQEDHIAVPVGELTYRLNVSVVLDKSMLGRKNPPSIREFGLQINSGNGTYNYDGTHAINSAINGYQPNGPVVYNDTALVAKYTVMDLQTGLGSQVRISHSKNGQTRDVEMPIDIQHDLIAAILAYASKPENKFSFNLNCEHDIDLKFLIKDKCDGCGQYMCTGVFINDWLVHTFDTELGK
jgi:hypothetical protein